MNCENLYAAYYEIDAINDEDGNVPLVCATKLFDILQIYKDIVIKNQFVIYPEKNQVINFYKQNYVIDFYEKNPKGGDYCIWFRQAYQKNIEIMKLLKMHGISMDFISISSLFKWNEFIHNADLKIIDLIKTNQAKFICHFDIDAALHLMFNLNYIKYNEIENLLLEWEESLCFLTQNKNIKRNNLHFYRKIQRQVQLRLF